MASEFLFFAAHLKGGIGTASANAVVSVGLSVVFAHYCGLTLHHIWFFLPGDRATEGAHAIGRRTRKADRADCREPTFDIKAVGRTAPATSFQHPICAPDTAQPSRCDTQKADSIGRYNATFEIECNDRSAPIADAACEFCSAFHEIISHQQLAVTEDTRAHQSPVVWFPERVLPPWEGRDRFQTPVLAAG